MNHPLLLSVAASIVLSAASFAGHPVSSEATDTSAPSFKMSYEANTTYEYVGGARTRLGRGNHGDVSEQYSAARLVMSPQWNSGLIYRIGFEWQRYSFGLPNHSLLPNTLQSFTAIVGADFQLFDSWLVRAEAQPGFYGDGNDLRGGNFNTPFFIGGSYIAGADLQWIVGVSVDFNRRYPVIPAVGVRWSFSDQWTLNAVLPNPRLEYAWSKELTIFAGGEVRGGTYRVGPGFGDARATSRLNEAIVEYLEVRVGAGISWKATEELNIELQGGYLPYRDFDFNRTGDNFETQGGAPYGQVSLNAKF